MIWCMVFPVNENSCNPQVDSEHPFPVFLLTGLSGAGKSSVLSVLEDMRFFAIDGLPLELVPKVIPLLKKDALTGYRGIVAGIDLNQQTPGHEFVNQTDELQRIAKDYTLVFVDAETQAVMRRYATTRRPHPLALGEEGGLEKAIELERQHLASVLQLADIVIDTSALNIHDLRRTLQKRFNSLNSSDNSFTVHIISFGFKYGAPAELDNMFDLRFLPNPYFIDELRPLNGKTEIIQKFVLSEEPGKTFIDKLLQFIHYLLPLYEAEGRYRVTFGFGCTGGKHRSVSVAEIVHKKLKSLGYAATIEHRNIQLG